MAKGPSDPRGAAGSQFFVMTADAPTLPADYAVIGRVTSGLDVVLQIGTLGDPATEAPTQAVVVERMTVREE
jgi:peptidyl-prolyl cis-trans isomerase B (cyclophilin B)